MKANIKYLFKIILAIICIVGFLTVTTSVFFFFNGFHNVDLGHNISLINARFNLNLVELASDYQIYTASQLYIMGFNQMKLGFVLALLGSLNFALGFAGLMKT